MATQAMEARVGSILHGRTDPTNRGRLQTDAFVRRQEARIRGVFTAITVYVAMATVSFVAVEAAAEKAHNSS